MVYLLLKMNSEKKLREINSLLLARNPFENFVVLKTNNFENESDDCQNSFEIRFYFSDIFFLTKDKHKDQHKTQA